MSLMWLLGGCNLLVVPESPAAQVLHMEWVVGTLLCHLVSDTCWMHLQCTLYVYLTAVGCRY